MKIQSNKTIFNMEVEKLSPIGKFMGLMFRSSLTSNLLFEFKKPKRHAIHSFFVFFPFLALWLNKKNQVLEHKIINPFTLYVRSSKPFQKLIEIPINKSNLGIIKNLVGKEKFK